jgi:hypothetical protein
MQKRGSGINTLIKIYKSKLIKAQDFLEATEGTRYSTCQGSYDVGYYQGTIDLLERLRPTKKATA